jgi:hypothetical protein
MSVVYLVFNTGVLSFSILSDQHGVDVIIRSLETLNGYAWSNVGKQVESSAKSKVERDMSLSN